MVLANPLTEESLVFNTADTIRYEDLLMLEAILKLSSPTQPYGASAEIHRLFFVRPFPPAFIILE